MSTKKPKDAGEMMERKYGRLTFADALRAHREADEISQTAFAKMLGISVQNLNDIEKGRKIPSPSRAAKIAKKLQDIEPFWVGLALRDTLYKEGLKYDVKLESA